MTMACRRGGARAAHNEENDFERGLTLREAMDTLRIVGLQGTLVRFVAEVGLLDSEGSE